MISAGELRKGRVIMYEGALCSVHEITHVTRGNLRSYMQAKLRRMDTGNMMDIRMRMDERFESPFLETKNYEFLYKDNNDFIFMDLETYDQVPISEDIVGDSHLFLKANEKCAIQFHEGKPLGLELPQVVELVITDTPPVVKGSTVTNQPKDAVLETGARVRVPAFVEPGEKIRVDTRSGEYIERAK